MNFLFSMSYEKITKIFITNYETVGKRICLHSYPIIIIKFVRYSNTP